LPEAVNAVFPKTLTQLCIVHLVRASLRYVATKDSKAVVAALQGYYFGSVRLNKRPDGWLLLEMVVNAGLTQVLIYYLGYVTLVLADGQHVSDVVSFGRYLDVLLTKAHLQLGMGASMHEEPYELGSVGYGVAAIYFVGFLLGGLMVWGFLRTRPFCSACDVYFRKLFKRSRSYADTDGALRYYNQIFSHPFESEEFASLLRAHSKVAKPTKGAVVIDTFLHGCPKCHMQLIEEKVQVHNGKQWAEVRDMKRRIEVPAGINLRNVFQSAR
jgi:hypothetical protein